MNRVVVTGIGILSSIGNNWRQIEQALRDGQSGIRPIPDWDMIDGMRPRVCGLVDDVDPKQIPRKFRRTMGRMAVLGSLASMDAVKSAALGPDDLSSLRTGLIMGSTIGSPEVLTKFFGEYHARGGVSGFEGTTFMKVMGHTVSANVSAVLGIRGQSLGVTSACAASTQAIGLGYEMIHHGLQDVMLCGGAEEVHPTSIGVFDVLGATSRKFNDTPHQTPRPFDADRDGLVLSEGAATIILESLDHAKARGADIMGEVIGYASLCDASHMTQPSKQAMAQCMSLAVESAGVEPADLDYINAHATGTLLGDATEADAIREFVADKVPVSGTKGYTGHPLAASGATETIFCLIMMKEGFIAPSLNLERISEECKGIAHVLSRQDRQLETVMCSSFAFGGTNASIVLRRI